jgi:hypothetical protein
MVKTKNAGSGCVIPVFCGPWRLAVRGGARRISFVELLILMIATDQPAQTKWHQGGCCKTTPSSWKQ